jgi:light-regulated signal transduction histidine kinase (bacteriophytochrome)
MRTITSFIGLIKRRLKDRLSEDEAGYIEHIENGTKRLIKLVDDMLSFAKIKSDNLALEDKNPKVLVENILDQLAVNIQEKNAIVTIHSDVENVYMDEIKIGRVIQNLIANALKFVPKDKQPIIDISIDDFENDTKFSIRDNGIGISEESQKVVFDVFKRVAHDSAYDGTGMGLAVCKKIVEHHSGKIWIDSTEGVGSTFVFTIPKKHKPELEYAD